MQKTETRNSRTMHIDQESTVGILRLIQDENYIAVKAIEEALPDIEKACDEITRRMALGGRLIYMGAGTSGRLGVMDAVECPPTYGVSRELISGIIAGGYDRMVTAAEGAEDNAEAGIHDLSEKNPGPNDTVLGISAAGNAAYVAEALSYARKLGCLTVGLSCNHGSRLDVESDISIVTDTGAEPITGSTRMKAGSAHKMVLNMISTCAMIKMGNVYENLMINLKPTNIKLKRRMISIVCEILGCEEDKAVELLEKYNWSIREAVEYSRRNEKGKVQ
ncbi:MAG: N-acetylmuramic acid 6-phosphate etherase [Lachnospiraceae bacterium]|nr:N-acetylmuramic acid 6-phosphate etherase [Lachnospiraceae bacterium]